MEFSNVWEPLFSQRNKSFSGYMESILYINIFMLYDFIMYNKWKTPFSEACLFKHFFCQSNFCLLTRVMAYSNYSFYCIVIKLQS